MSIKRLANKESSVVGQEQHYYVKKTKMLPKITPLRHVHRDPV